MFGTLLSRIGLALVMTGALAAAPAAAQDACNAGWPMGAERARLTDPALEALSSGARVQMGGEAALRLDLKPWPEAGLPHAPDRPPAADSFAGYLTLTGSGLMQITLSDAAWVDLIVDSKSRSPATFTSVHGCPGVRKSLRFQLPDTPTPLVLQVSGAQQPVIGIVLRRLP